MAGTVIGAFGVMEYMLTLFWVVEAIGLALLILAVILITLTLGRTTIGSVE